MKVGLSDLSLYFPARVLSVDQLIQFRKQEDLALAKLLERIQQKIGQRAFSVPLRCEDAVTMIAQATQTLLQRHIGGPLDFRAFLVGTESSVDLSKSISSYVQGLLVQHWELPKNWLSYQIQHACFGGVAALLQGLFMARALKERTLGACGDIARYQSSSTAEITQGAGAAAYSIEQNPLLIEIDIQILGCYSKDKNDFLKPLALKGIPLVDGAQSLKAYVEAFEECLLDLAQRSDKTVAQILSLADHFVMHTPYAQMPEFALSLMHKKYLCLQGLKVQSHLKDKFFYASLEPFKDRGNSYTASFFAHLYFTLQVLHQELGSKILGRRILCFAYGAGATSAVFWAYVAPLAGTVLATWPHNPPVMPISVEDYYQWQEFFEQSDSQKFKDDFKTLESGQFFLKNLDQREYAISK